MSSRESPRTVARTSSNLAVVAHDRLRQLRRYRAQIAARPPAAVARAVPDQFWARSRARAQLEQRTRVPRPDSDRDPLLSARPPSGELSDRLTKLGIAPHREPRRRPPRAPAAFRNGEGGHHVTRPAPQNARGGDRVCSLPSTRYFTAEQERSTRSLRSAWVRFPMPQRPRSILTTFNHL